jgi:hypothetical protein
MGNHWLFIIIISIIIIITLLSTTALCYHQGFILTVFRGIVHGHCLEDTVRS